MLPIITILILTNIYFIVGYFKHIKKALLYGEINIKSSRDWNIKIIKSILVVILIILFITLFLFIPIKIRNSRQLYFIIGLFIIEIFFLIINPMKKIWEYKTISVLEHPSYEQYKTIYEFYNKFKFYPWYDINSIPHKPMWLEDLQEIRNLQLKNLANLTSYTKWYPKQLFYYLEFNGKAPNYSISIDKSGYLNIPTPEKAGYEFVCWQSPNEIKNNNIIFPGVKKIVEGETQFFDYINFNDRYLIAVWALTATDENIKEILTNEVHKLGNKANLNHIDVSQLSIDTLSWTISILNDLEFIGEIYNWHLSKDLQKEFEENCKHHKIHRESINKKTRLSYQ
ncbi:MAG: hypothetical protein EOL97_02255 [Spirochaetia bacterium]|nr:hypothetical protein [Spirochaetia bacterium]